MFKMMRIHSSTNKALEYMSFYIFFTCFTGAFIGAFEYFLCWELGSWGRGGYTYYTYVFLDEHFFHYF